MIETDDILREFLVESYENLDRMERDLLGLETQADRRAVLDSVFRTIHTIKGTCGFLGYPALEKLGHAGENLLSLLRAGAVEPTPTVVTALLSTCDAVRTRLARIEATGEDVATEEVELLRLLEDLQSEEPEPTVQNSPVLFLAHPSAPPRAPEPAVSVAVAVASPSTVHEPAEALPEVSAGDVAQIAIADSTIRVDVQLLDKVMNLVGELVLARNQILQLSTSLKNPSLGTTSQRLSLITTELQEGVMKTRMQTIGNVWNKLPRLVRDLCGELGKQVRLDMEGRETELDKTLIEAIKDPLTHLVRNAVDHGLETPELRAARGKPAEGRILLRAFHEGGQVNVEISDDGGGIDLARVRERGVSAGLVSPERAARMSEREVIDLIFHPGLSTTDRLSRISGRGVGMDVVKTNIENIGGSVDVSSRLGGGTTIRIKIPLTLAIVPALVVGCGGDRYAIPQASLLELVRLEGAEISNRISWILDTPVYRLREQLLPLVNLHDVLGDDRARATEALSIVVLQAGDRPFGLVVDRIDDTQEIVVKPLARQLHGLPTFSGATIMGDGRVALILDVLGLAQRSNVLSEVRQRALSELSSSQATEETLGKFLLFVGPGDARMAVPLEHVSRLEEFPLAAIERAGGHDYVQYRGDILPIVRVGDVMEERRSRARIEAAEAAGASATGKVPVVVQATETGDVGIAVSRILDIVEVSTKNRRPATRDGAVGTVLIQGRVTELLDLDWIVRAAGLGLSPHHARRGNER